MAEHYCSVLALRRLKARVHLGVGTEERKYPQEIEVDVRFYLPRPPSAATDERGDYICYHDIGEKIHALCVKGEYQLIEYLTHEIYRLLRMEVHNEVKLWIRLHKLKTLLAQVQDGTSYTYTDLPPDAWVVPQ